MALGPREPLDYRPVMVTVDREPPLRWCRLDTGPKNLLDLAAVRDLEAALVPDDEAPVVVLSGRPDAFCAGLDMKVLARPEEATELLGSMGRLLVRTLESGVRVVAVCEGHAVAAGAMLMLVSDVRLGAPGDYKIGFTEPRVGMPLPELPALLARERVDPRRYHELTALGRTVGPEEAVDVGFLDEMASAEALRDRAAARGREIAALPADVYARSNQAAHRALIERARAIVGA